jgi:hypothetical protein
MPSPPKLKVCPRCLGTRIDLHLGGYAGKIYRCQDCGYIGAVILETTLDRYGSAGDQGEGKGETGKSDE